MTPNEIDAAKRKYTDQSVRVASPRPELARFAHLVGRVKTVNMNGKALVEFAPNPNNNGWYDIALDELEIVTETAPTPPSEEEPSEHN